MKTSLNLFSAILLFCVTTACNHLSDEAENMIGNYYLTTVSENEPVMELKSDGTCILHAIKPGVLSYTVNGQWNVERDSLLITTDGKAASVTGDTTLVRIGRIPTEKSYAIAGFNGLSLTLTQDGNEYVFTRRVQNTDPVQSESSSGQ
ncbi:MAG: hypothetical protein K2L46_01150 [Paramuribaculum sp.]|nr:hypothetical protein [Paramuribaculum sp.]MDE6487865.1 hypothetical protein [Paramuribaculum sp.]